MSIALTSSTWLGDTKQLLWDKNDIVNIWCLKHCLLYMNWCCLTSEEVKGLYTSGFLIMTLAFSLVFIFFFQGAGQARLNSPKALIWLHVSSFTQWDPNTKAGIAQQLRVLYTAVTGTSCSLQSKHAAAYVRVCHPWHPCTLGTSVGLHSGQMVVNIFSSLVDLAKDMKASVLP